MSKLSHQGTSQSQVAPAPKNYVVENEDINERLSQFEEAEPVVFRMPPPKPVSKDLEKLIFIGRLTQIVEIGDTKFEISSLTNKEYNQILETLYRFKEASDLFKVRIVTLANCLRKIDGVSLDNIEIEGKFEDDFHKRISVIDNLQLLVVEKLYAAYEKLVAAKEEKEAGAEKELKNS